MSVIEWKDQYSVGIQEIDEQHKSLVKLMDQLNEAYVLKLQKNKIGAILTELVDYTKIHFAVEESLMRIVQYKDYEAHKAIHDEITETVLGFQHRFNNGDSEAAKELMTFMINWLFTHIDKVDGKYTETFLKSGIKRKWYKKFW